RVQVAPLNLSDEQLLDKARNAKNGAKFIALFDQGDLGQYGGDQSAADFALAGMLAFWAGPGESRTERLVNRSAWGQRDKWTDRADYREMTIGNALEDMDTFYKPKNSVRVGKRIQGHTEKRHVGTNGQANTNGQV